MENNIVKEVSEMFSGDKQRNVFRKYIEYIRFPFFKNFEKDMRINFTYPLTFITGTNGSGKSSILHALYGSPEGKSIAEFWYTTAMDQIKDDIKDNRHCFIYSFYTSETKTQVEVLKTRIKKENNLEYWEPARPSKKYGMESLPENPNLKEATQTRWKLLQQEVDYVDFRHSLSAYDKYFYFGSKPNTKTMKSKQDLIRKYSKKLKQSFDSNKSVSYYHGKKYTTKLAILSESEKEEISKILGKNYKEIKILEHNFYNKMTGFAVKYNTTDISYSEAFAGSGETAVVKLIHDLMNVKEYSLILLDEPETSLHPEAQRNLIKFLLKQIKLKKLQIVVSTHSPDIIEGMPKESIKVIYENPVTNKINVIENVVPQEAFVRLGRFTDKRIIIVEDSLAKLIVNKILEDNENDFKGLFEVRFFPGGASRIYREEMIVYSKEDGKKHFVIFDGDQRGGGKIDIRAIPDNQKNLNDLREKIKNITNNQEVKFITDSGPPEKQEEQEKDQMLKYIDYHYHCVFYLPKNKPEEIIWSDEVFGKADMDDEKKTEIKKEEDIKKKFNLFAKYNWGDNSNEYHDKAYEYFILRWLKKPNDDYTAIKDILQKIKENTPKK